MGAAFSGSTVKTFAVALVAGWLATSACVDTVAPVRTQVTNDPDLFEFHMSAAHNAAVTREYSWETTATSATVLHATSITSGSATLLILDATGTQLYFRDLAENGTFQTAEGVSGTWLIRLVFTRVSGNVTVRVSKP